MSTTWIRVAYAAVLGAVIAITVGFGVATFITGPRPPQPLGLTFQQLSDQNATDQQQQRQAKQIDSFFSDALAYRQNYPEYQRNLFLALAAFGLLSAVIGVALPAVVNYLRLGFIIGGVLLLAAATYIAVQPVPYAFPPSNSLLALLAYGQPTVLDTAGRFLRFAVSFVGFLLLLFVGLWRLTDWVVLPRPVESTGAVPQPAFVTPAPASPPSPAAPMPRADDPLRWAPPEVRATYAPPMTPVPGAQEHAAEAGPAPFAADVVPAVPPEEGPRLAPNRADDEPKP